MRIFAVLLILLWNPLAQAQVFYCRDSKGTLQAGDSTEDLALKCGKPAQSLGSNVSSKHVHIVLQHDGNGLLAPVSFGAGGDATLLLDTGASLTFIPKRVAKKLGLPVKQRAQITTAAGLIMVDLVELPEISVGGATVKNLTVAAFDIPSQKSEGLLGLDFLNHFKVSIDTVSGELDLEKK